MGWLLGAALAPDLWRLALAGSGYAWWPSNTLSHALPWSAFIAVVLGSVAWLVLRDATAAILVALLVASHIALDMVSGWKPLWIGGPSGLNVQSIEQAELLLEALLAWLGWRALRAVRPQAGGPREPHCILMLVVQLAYLKRTYDTRPKESRCLTFPISRCWRRL
jgi:hypothetical protein